MKVNIYCMTIKHYRLIDKLPKNIIPFGLGKNNFPSNWLNEKEGDSIIDLNKFFGEATGIYWIWKNLMNNYDKKSLNEVIPTSGDEQKRLSNFSFEYFIGYSPNQNGNNSSAQKKPGTNKIYYTIFSCGCDGSQSTCRSQSNKIVALEAVVTLSIQ